MSGAATTSTIHRFACPAIRVAARRIVGLSGGFVSLPLSSWRKSLTSRPTGISASLSRGPNCFRGGQTIPSTLPMARKQSRSACTTFFRSFGCLQSHMNFPEKRRTGALHQRRYPSKHEHRTRCRVHHLRHLVGSGDCLRSPGFQENESFAESLQRVPHLRKVEQSLKHGFGVP